MLIWRLLERRELLLLSKKRNEVWRAVKRENWSSYFSFINRWLKNNHFSNIDWVFSWIVSSHESQSPPSMEKAVRRERPFQIHWIESLMNVTIRPLSCSESYLSETLERYRVFHTRYTIRHGDRRTGVKKTLSIISLDSLMPSQHEYSRWGGILKFREIIEEARFREDWEGNSLNDSPLHSTILKEGSETGLRQILSSPSVLVSWKILVIRYLVRCAKSTQRITNDKSHYPRERERG